MNSSIFLIARRTVLLCLYAFLFFAYLHSQDLDSSITISHFQYPEIEGIPIIVDEVGQNTYFLDDKNPEFMSDMHISQVQLDGSLGIPLGSYFLPDLLPRSSEGDSIHNHSQIYYRKGDYDYSDLGIGLQIESSDSGLFIFQGFKRTPPNKFASDELQNYLISYESKKENSHVIVDAFYHIENYNLPFLGNINRKVESFHGGLGIEQNWEKLSLCIQSAFQFSYINRWGTKVSNLTVWSLLNSEYHLWESTSLILDHNYKMITTEKDNQMTEIPFQIISPYIKYENDKISIQAGITSYDISIMPVGLAVWQLNNFYLSVGRNYNVVLTPIENYVTKLVSYSTDAFIIGYENKKFNGNVKLFQTQHNADLHFGVQGNADIDLSWFQLAQSAGIYNLGSNESHAQSLDMFSHTRIIFSPNIWRWKNARYQPFIGVESTYILHSGKLGIDPENSAVFSTIAINPYSSNLLNLEIGFLVNRFKVSYRWINFNIMGANSINQYPYSIIPIRHLEVVWQFWN